MADKKILNEAQDRLEWIDKRAGLSDTQKEYVGFMLNEQEKFISLLSAHIYATSGCLMMGDLEQAKLFLCGGKNDIKNRKNGKS